MAHAALCDYCKSAVPFDSYHGQLPAPDGWFAVRQGYPLHNFESAFRMGLPSMLEGDTAQVFMFCSRRCIAAWAMVSQALEASNDR